MQNRKSVETNSGGPRNNRKLPVIIVIILAILIGIFYSPISSSFLFGDQDPGELLDQLENYVSDEQEENTFISETEETIQPTQIVTDVSGTLEMHVIDVGQADSLLFIQGDEVMLVDAGTRGAGDDVVNYLKALGIEEIDILIGTHPHEDHMGGMKKVLQNFDVKCFYFPQRSDVTTKYYLETLEYIVEKQIPCGEADAGDRISLGEASIQFITSTEPKEDKDLNNCSIVIRVTYGEIDFFLGGDIEKEVESEILASGMEIESEIYKASHHGSSTSNTREMLETVNPDYIYISCGLYNKHNHPHKSVINLFEELKIPVYRTDESGSIKVVTDGKTISTDKEPGTYISGEEKNEGK